MKKIKRREFLNNTCPRVAMAILGVSFLNACSKESEEVIMPEGDSGYAVNGKIIEISTFNYSN